MALFSAFKEEMKQFSSLLRKVGGTSARGAMGDNFRRFGTSMGAYDFDEFEELARSFYHEAINSDDPDYSIITMQDKRTAIDHNGEVRGVFDKYGNPLAFFRPNFQQLGYQSKAQELADFRSGKSLLYT